MKSYEEINIVALKHARNLHQIFVKYLLGLITWGEFIADCRRREAKYEKEVKL